jgi:hypothetical protein
MTRKPEALVVFLGGPLDGQTGTVSSHAELVIEHDDVAHYHRTDQQQGDHRVYQWTIGEGLSEPTIVIDPVGQRNTLHDDMAILADERAAEEKAAKAAQKK